MYCCAGGAMSSSGVSQLWQTLCELTGTPFPHPSNQDARQLLWRLQGYPLQFPDLFLPAIKTLVNEQDYADVLAGLQIPPLLLRTLLREAIETGETKLVEELTREYCSRFPRDYDILYLVTKSIDQYCLQLESLRVFLQAFKAHLRATRPIAREIGTARATADAKGTALARAAAAAAARLAKAVAERKRVRFVLQPFRPWTVCQSVSHAIKRIIGAKHQ